MLISAAEGIMSIISLIIIGYVLACKKWFNEDSANLIVKLIIQVCVFFY